MKNVHLIEAKQPCRLHYYNYLDHLGLSKENLQWKQGRNIYITSDEEIKEDGTWCYRIGIGAFKVYKKDKHPYGYAKKIILTTDQELIKDGVQAIDDEFLEWFVAHPRCEEVEVWINKFYGNKKEMLFNVYGKYKIIIPKEEQKQETLEETCTCTDECLGYLTKTCKGIEEEHKQETFDQYLQRLKDRRTEDNYKYTDEDFKNYIHHIFDCYEKNVSVYKCLEFMYFMEREIKLEDVFNDEKKEGLKQFILDHKKSLLINEEDLREAFLQGWMIRERFDDLSPDIIYPAGLDYEEKQHYAFTLWFDKFKNK